MWWPDDAATALYFPGLSTLGIPTFIIIFLYMKIAHHGSIFTFTAEICNLILIELDHGKILTGKPDQSG